MLKYVSTALALKCFSRSAFLRSVYRQLGNQVGNKRRSNGKMPAYYIERIKRMLALQKKFGLVSNGDRILELGTGWLHWEALSLRLFFDVRCVLFDVWDNRQLGGLKNYIRQLRPLLASELNLSAAEKSRAQNLTDEILKVNTFEQLYQLLDFEYVVESSGSLAQLEAESFQLVVSGGVLEHVYREAIPTVISETQRILKPGGWAVHSIDTADHLEHYDRSVSPKLYLTFSEKTWKRCFENDVQYINRLQRGEWLEMFKSGGLELLEEEARRVDISKLKISEQYAHMVQSDLECTVLKLAMRKPQSAGIPAVSKVAHTSSECPA